MKNRPNGEISPNLVTLCGSVQGACREQIRGVGTRGGRGGCGEREGAWRVRLLRDSLGGLCSRVNMVIIVINSLL